MTNNDSSYFPIVVSIFALLVSLISMIIAYKKYSYDKGKILGILKKIDSDTSFKFYPYMVSDDTTFFIEVNIINTGLKDVFIQNVERIGINSKKYISNIEDDGKYVNIVGKDQK